MLDVVEELLEEELDQVVGFGRYGRAEGRLMGDNQRSRRSCLNEGGYPVSSRVFCPASRRFALAEGVGKATGVTAAELVQLILGRQDRIDSASVVSRSCTRTRRLLGEISRGSRL